MPELFDMSIYKLLQNDSLWQSRLDFAALKHALFQERPDVVSVLNCTGKGD